MPNENSPKLDPYLPLPNHILIQQDVCAEAAFYAKAYKKAKTPEEREKVVNGLLRNGGCWDVITRSCIYYQEFENVVGKKFPGLWRDD